MRKLYIFTTITTVINCYTSIVVICIIIIIIYYYYCFYVKVFSYFKTIDNKKILLFNKTMLY